MRRGALLRHTLVTVVALVLGALAPLARAQTPAPVVILVSLDGFRADYFDRADLPALRGIASLGVRAEALLPSFPTLTFPNHWTIVTGLAPDHHGIVSNTMVDRSIGPTRFTMSAATANDPRWWGGEPIWTTAIRQGRKGASMFWPGSEAIQPTYWKPYDGSVPNMDRVREVLEWLALPDAQRPSFITLYFSDVDTASHDFGPDSSQTFAAVRRLDDLIDLLMAGIGQSRVKDVTSVVFVSDHGLAATSADRVVVLDDYVSRNEVDVIDGGAWLALNPSATTTADAVYRKLAGRHPALTIYKKDALPAALRYGTHARVPAIVGLLQTGWTVTWRDRAISDWMDGRPQRGAHGYDSRAPEMRALFIAAGPRVRRGLVTPPVENIHLYAFLCELLGIRPAPNDGDPARTAPFIVR